MRNSKSIGKETQGVVREITDELASTQASMAAWRRAAASDEGELEILWQQATKGKFDTYGNTVKHKYYAALLLDDKVKGLLDDEVTNILRNHIREEAKARESTAGRTAAWKVQKEILIQLIAGNVDLTLEDKHGETALYKVADIGRLHLAIQLLRSKVDKWWDQLFPSKDPLALMLDTEDASDLTSWEEMIQMLRDGVDLNWKDKHGKTPLNTVAKIGVLGTVMQVFKSIIDERLGQLFASKDPTALTLNTADKSAQASAVTAAGIFAKTDTIPMPPYSGYGGSYTLV